MTGSRRRDEAIRHAADLLREGGPAALTSVAVASRMGITQSAIYRHVRNMDELSGLAAAVLIEELQRVIETALVDPGIDWEQMTEIARLCRALVDVIAANSAAFSVVDQWRFVGGDLGRGIQATIADAQRLVANILESRWRVEFGHEPPLTTAEAGALARHAETIHNEVHAVARLVRSPQRDPALDHAAIADILRFRIIGGWVSFVIDMNARVGLPFPQIDIDQSVVVD